MGARRGTEQWLHGHEACRPAWQPALVDAVRQAGVRDPRVLDAVRGVSRELFVPRDSVNRANIDEPVPIAHDQVTTQPSLLARMVEALKLSGTERVLEIGTGLGYQTAILGTMAREVHSIELWPDLAAAACRNVKAAGVGNIAIVAGDGTLGFPSRARYDAMIVAAAAPTVPRALVEQLAEGGRLVQPIGRGGNEMVTRFQKRHGALMSEGPVAAARFVPLVNRARIR